jgi:hypothetical protein
VYVVLCLQYSDRYEETQEIVTKSDLTFNFLAMAYAMLTNIDRYKQVGAAVLRGNGRVNSPVVRLC